MIKNAKKFEIDNLNLYYGDFQALKGVNMDISANQITAFIGPSGCGKSTFLKSLNRMNDLVEGCKIDGSVKLDGKDIYGKIDINTLRKRIGMVFQSPNPFPMTVYDNIAYGPKTHGVHSKKKLDAIVEKSLKQAAIWEELKDRLKKSALDPISTSKIEDLVTDLKKEYTIVMVTHNMQQAARISDYTAFFLLGEVIEYAGTESMFQIPCDKRTEDYITGRFG